MMSSVKKLDSIHSEFGIENKVTVTVTDSGSNFLKAFAVFGKTETDQETSDEAYDDSELEYDDSLIVCNFFYSDFFSNLILFIFL